MLNKKTKKETVKAEALCISAQDTLFTILTESFPFIHWNRYIAQYAYEYEENLYYKYIIFKKKEEGTLTHCHPFKIELTFDPAKPEKAKWNGKKIM